MDECQIYLEGVGRWTVSTPINPDARPIGTNETKMAARNVVCVRVTQSQSILTTDGLQKIWDCVRLVKPVFSFVTPLRGSSRKANKACVLRPFVRKHRRWHHWRSSILGRRSAIGSLSYGDYGLRTTAGQALFSVRSTGLSRANIER